MSEVKNRLLEEKSQLDERRVKLETFQASEGFGQIPPQQQSLLNVQAQIMLSYSQVLTERIALFVED